MARPIEDSAAATVSIKIVKNCPTNRSRATELERNKISDDKRISSIEINNIIRCPRLIITPVTPRTSIPSANTQ